MVRNHLHLFRCAGNFVQSCYNGNVSFFGGRVRVLARALLSGTENAAEYLVVGLLEARVFASRFFVFALTTDVWYKRWIWMFY